MSQRYARTQIRLQDGSYIDARLCFFAGEIKPYTYPAREAMLKPTAKLRLESDAISDPSWITTPCRQLTAYATPALGKTGKKAKVNPNNVFIQHYLSLAHAVEDIAKLESLITGVSNLGIGGDTKRVRPINKGLLFAMLRDIDVITKDSVQAYTGLSDSHCYRLAAYLRVASMALDNIIEA